MLDPQPKSLEETPVQKHQTIARGWCQIPKGFHQILTFHGYGGMVQHPFI
jgi:hypothetical protein